MYGQIAYKNRLLAQIGLPSVEKWKVDCFNETARHVRAKVDGFRDLLDNAYWEAFFKVAICSILFIVQIMCSTKSHGGFVFCVLPIYIYYDMQIPNISCIIFKLFIQSKCSLYS